MVFVFRGVGAQWSGMCRTLLHTSSIFRDTIIQIDHELRKYVEWSLYEELKCKDEAVSRMNQASVAQLSLFALQVGISRWFEARGIEPAAVVGHSVGEVAAAFRAGIFDQSQAVYLAQRRSTIQEQATGTGCMLAVGLSKEEVVPFLTPYDGTVEVACLNAARMVTLSGDTASIKSLAEKFQNNDIFHRELPVNVPFHSRRMDQLKQNLERELQSLAPQEGKIPFYSTVTAGVVSGISLDSEYWYRNVRQPVLFFESATQLVLDGFTEFLEIGPHPALQRGLKDALMLAKHESGMVLSTLRRDQSTEVQLLTVLGSLYASGNSVSLSSAEIPCKHVEGLPFYPWNEESFWNESNAAKVDRLCLREHPHLINFRRSVIEEGHVIWDVDLDAQIHPYVADHRISGPIVFPGAGHVEMTLAAATISYGKHFGFLEDIYFENMLFLPDDGEPVTAHLELGGPENDISLYTSSDKGQHLRQCSRGRINRRMGAFKCCTLPSNVKEMAVKETPVGDMYERIGGDLYMGPASQGMKRLYRGENWVYCEIEAAASISHELNQFYIHPALLDACFQSLSSLFLEHFNDPNQKLGVYIPVKVGRFRFYERAAGTFLNVYGTLDYFDEYKAGGHVWVYDGDGTFVAEVQDLQLRYLDGSRGVEDDISNWLYDMSFCSRKRRDDSRIRDSSLRLDTLEKSELLDEIKSSNQGNYPSVHTASFC
ncbi:hypothetical protein ACA910_010559 [Epithemia clementina (nom. ined.)]